MGKKPEPGLSVRLPLAAALEMFTPPELTAHLSSAMVEWEAAGRPPRLVGGPPKYELRHNIGFVGRNAPSFSHVLVEHARMPQHGALLAVDNAADTRINALKQRLTNGELEADYRTAFKMTEGELAPIPVEFWPEIEFLSHFVVDKDDPRPPNGMGYDVQPQKLRPPHLPSLAWDKPGTRGRRFAWHVHVRGVLTPEQAAAAAPSFNDIPRTPSASELTEDSLVALLDRWGVESALPGAPWRKVADMKDAAFLALPGATDAMWGRQWPVAVTNHPTLIRPGRPKKPTQKTSPKNPG